MAEVERVCFASACLMTSGKPASLAKEVLRALFKSGRRAPDKTAIVS